MITLTQIPCPYDDEDGFVLFSVNYDGAPIGEALTFRSDFGLDPAGNCQQDWANDALQNWMDKEEWRVRDVLSAISND